MRVILRPLKVNTWSGLKKGATYRNCHEDLAPYWTRSGRKYTGLTKAEEEKYGKLLGIDLSNGSEFWENFFIRTWGKDLYLNIEDPLDAVKYAFLKGNKFVKNSLLENKAGANFALINKDEEAKRSNLLGKVKRWAGKEFDKLTPEDMRSCLRLYGLNGDTLSNELVEEKLFKIVEGNPESFIQRWVQNTDRDMQATVERAIATNVIRRNKNIYKYGTEIIGHSLQDTVSYLENPKNQDLKITILKQVESKNYITKDKEVVSNEDLSVEEVLANALKQEGQPFESPEPAGPEGDTHENKVDKVDTILAKKVVKKAKKNTIKTNTI